MSRAREPSDLRTFAILLLSGVAAGVVSSLIVLEITRRPEWNGKAPLPGPVAPGQNSA